MGHTLRLTFLMLVAALLGSVAFSVLFLKMRPVFRYTYTISYDWKVAGAMIGAILGLAFELTLRILHRPRFRFSIGELLVAMTLTAAAVVVIGGLLQWLTA